MQATSRGTVSRSKSRVTLLARANVEGRVVEALAVMHFLSLTFTMIDVGRVLVRPDATTL